MCGPDDPIWFVADVSLEEPERGVGPRPVQPVLLPAVEAEGVQHPLELANVVASEHGGAVIQGAIAELPPGLDELFPRVGTDEPVDLEVSVPLEPSDGGLRRRAERSVALSVVHGGPERRQPRLDVRDLRTSVAHTVDAHRSESAGARDATATAASAAVGKWPYDRCGSRSRKMASLGRAPVTLTTSTPALKRMSEGIDITP